MNHRALLIICLSLGLAALTPAAAMERQTMTVAGDTSVKIQVDGKPWVPGTAIPQWCRITTSGPVTLKIGNRTITTDGAAKIGLGTDGVTMLEGSATVALGDRSVSVKQGQVVATQGSFGSAGSVLETSFGVDAIVVVLPPPPPSVKQNASVVPVSPSAP